MDKEIKFTIENPDIDGEINKKRSSKTEKKHNKRPEKAKSWLVFLICGIIGMVGGMACLLVGLLAINNASVNDDFDLDLESDTKQTYSLLTGQILADESDKNAPVYCVQIPNGLDGARPQAGLTEAGVAFEAIAEAGITRFAAIYQNPSSAVIGPIRSLRIYYLDWDTPFDCAIVHAGGSADALAAVAAGGYKDLSEDYAYMYRGNHGARLWNNLFTTSSLLKKYSENTGFSSSNINGFKRMTPSESKISRIDALAKEKLDITSAAKGNTSELEEGVNNIHLRFGGVSTFNVDYSYDSSSNTYKRSYESGTPHETYECPKEDLGERNPEEVCTLTQLAPNVVVAMVVKESRASDGYHEDITTIGAGPVYIFQNGTVLTGTWEKASRSDQIKFYDDNKKELALAPGQTFVSAIPNYGSVDY